MNTVIKEGQVSPFSTGFRGSNLTKKFIILKFFLYSKDDLIDQRFDKKQYPDTQKRQTHLFGTIE